MGRDFYIVLKTKTTLKIKVVLKLLGNVGKECNVSCSLDSLSKLTLMSSTNAGHSAR